VIELHQFQGFAPTVTLSRESRTITGTITVFNTPTSDYRRIVLADGALIPRMPLSRVKMLRDHDQRDPVGFMASLSSDTRTATFSIPEGANGDRALEEAANGLRDGLSVGFNVLTNDDGTLAASYDEETGTWTVYAAELVEVSLCAIPAYQDAGVTDVKATRSTPPKEKTTMDPETLTAEALDAALSAQTEAFERTLDSRLAALDTTATASGPTWATFGAFIKDLTAAKPEALSFYQELAYGGATTGDDATRNTWVAEAIHLVDKNRKVLNSFTRETLPSDGMTLEYVKLKSNSMTVAKQTAEGADLTFGKIELDSDTAPVETYGGYTELTRQIIERASAAYSTTAFKAMDLEYARATEAATRALLAAVIAEHIAADDNLDLPAAPGTDDWLDLLVDATEAFEDRGYTLEAGKVSADVFKMLLRLEDTAGNRVMLVSGQGVNTVGTIDFSSLTGKLGPVRFELYPGAAAKTVAFYDPLAITTWESAGAPFQLQQENAINLSTAFSKYGYVAQASQHPEALLPVVIAAP
jgi:HK97 family phage prohead protease